MSWRLFLLLVLLATPLAPPSAAGRAGKPRPKKVVLLAGPLDKGHPRGTHEYAKSVRLLKECLENSPDAHGVTVEAHFNGWPATCPTCPTRGLI